MKHAIPKRGRTRQSGDDQHVCWTINNLLAELGCKGVVDCQPTSEPGLISVAFGFDILKKQVHVDRRKFGTYLTTVQGTGEVSRDAILHMLERKFEQFTNQSHHNQ